MRAGTTGIPNRHLVSSTNTDARSFPHEIKQETAVYESAESVSQSNLELVCKAVQLRTKLFGAQAPDQFLGADQKPIFISPDAQIITATRNADAEVMTDKKRGSCVRPTVIEQNFDNSEPAMHYR